MKLLLENWREFVELNEGIDPETIKKIVDAIQSTQSHGDPNRPGERLYGEAYIVGGAVRDELMPDPTASKDVDFVVRNLTLKQISDAVESVGGKAKEAGAEFSVITARIDNEEFDFALPRKLEKKTGLGHTDVEVVADPFLSIEEDMARRDFTMNAIAKTPSGEIMDNAISQQGIEDIQNRIIRAVGDPNERFNDDPLRMLRAVQFATRFDFDIEAETMKSIKANIHRLSDVTNDRYGIELAKAWTKGKGAEGSRRLVALLNETGMGKMMYGEDFDPRPVAIEGDNLQKILGNAMAFFLHGGDYKKLILEGKEEPGWKGMTGNTHKYIELAREAAEDTKEVYKYAEGQRERLPLIASVLRQVGMTQQADKIEEALQFPLSPAELDISGGDMMQLGFRGQEIGDTLKKVLAAVHNGQVDNNYNDIIGFIGQ